jgi:hypothetical protein
MVHIRCPWYFAILANESFRYAYARMRASIKDRPSKGTDAVIMRPGSPIMGRAGTPSGAKDNDVDSFESGSSWGDDNHAPGTQLM